VFHGLFTFALWCASAWFVVRMNVGLGAHWLCCQSAAGREISKEEGAMPLTSSSTMVEVPVGLRLC